MTDDSRDAHLRQALRHAPDASMAPPPELSALILKEAHAKARDAQAPAAPARHPLATWWRRLTHPALATGLAGVMVATLVGLMWWDQPMNEAGFRPPPPAAAPSSTPATTPPTTAQAPAPNTSVPASNTPTAPARGSTTPSAEQADNARGRAPAITAPQRADDDAAARKRRAQSEQAMADSRDSETRAKKADAPAPRVEDPPQAVQKNEAPPTTSSTSSTPAAPPAPHTAPAAPVGMAELASSEPAPAPMPNPRADASLSGAGPESSASVAAAIPPRASDNARLRAIAPAAAPLADRLETRPQATELRQPLASVRKAIAADPSRWTWQRGSGAEWDMNDALQSWLAQLDTAAGTAWRPRTALEGSSPRGRELRLLRDGRALHSLRLTEHGVLWDNEQAAWEAELPAGTAAALQTTLDAVSTY